MTENTTTEVSTETSTKTDPLDNPEINRAAYDFGRVSRMIRAYAKTMGGKGLARVLIATTEFPFAEKYPKFRSKAEQELFMMVLQSQGLKSIMAKAVEDSKKEIEDAAVSGVVDEVLAERAEEQTQGETNV